MRVVRVFGFGLTHGGGLLRRRKIVKPLPIGKKTVFFKSVRALAKIVSEYSSEKNFFRKKPAGKLALFFFFFLILQAKTKYSTVRGSIPPSGGSRAKTPETMKIKTTFLLSFILVLLWSGCKKDPPCDDPENPECPNYDRCLTVPKTNADFGFFRRSSSGAFSVFLPYRDTIPIRVGPIRIYFKASDSGMSSYEWRVGSDPRTFTDSVFFLDFSNVSGWVNVSLTTRNQKFDSQCFPGDSGKVTVNKGIFFKAYTVEHDTAWVQHFPIFGAYTGHDEQSPQDTFSIRIWFDHINNRAALSQFPKDCNRQTAPVHFTTHYIYFNSTHCLKPDAYGELLDDNRTLVIDYTLDGPNWTRVNRRWRGVKTE